MIDAVLLTIGFIIVIGWAIFTSKQPDTSICALVKANGGKRAKPKTNRY